MIWRSTQVLIRHEDWMPWILGDFVLIEVGFVLGWEWGQQANFEAQNHSFCWLYGASNHLTERDKAKFGAAEISTPLLLGLDTAILGRSGPYHPKPSASLYMCPKMTKPQDCRPRFFVASC